jgi:hypothetical protein
MAAKTSQDGLGLVLALSYGVRSCLVAPSNITNSSFNLKWRFHFCLAVLFRNHNC